MDRCATLVGAALGEGAFSPGPAIWVGTREVAHFDSDGALDVRLTKQLIRQRREEFKANPRVSLRGSGSDWLAVTIESPADVDFAFDLVALAVSQNLETAPPGLPPSGSELERRRRFH